LGTKLRRFIVGNASKTNNAVAEISGLKQLEALQYLDIQGMAGIKSLDLSNHKYFETLKAFGSGISSVSFTPGAPVKYLELPSTMRVLQLEQLPHLKLKDIVCEDISYLDHIHITECPNVTNDFNTIYNWYLNKRTDSSECSLVLDNVVWENIAPNKLIELGNLGEVSLKGKITLTSITNEQASSIVEIFGENAFNSSSELYISAPLTVVTLGRSEILEGEKEQYKTIVIGEKAISITRTIKSGSNSYVLFNAETGLLTVTEGYGNGSIVIETTVMTETRKNVSTFTVNVVKRVFPTLANSSIIGSSTIDNERENYTFEYTDEGVTGEFELQWSITGLDQYLAVESSGLLSSVVRVVNNIETYGNGEIVCKVIKKSTNSELFSVTKPISMMNINIAEIDAGVCKSLYDAGLCANETYITKEEAKLVQDDDLMVSASTSIFYQNRNNIKTFNGFKYFTSITKIPKQCFYFCSSLTSIELPPNVKDLGDACFQSTTIESITIPTAVKAISNYCFENCINLKSCILSENTSIIGTSAFERCSKLESIQLPEGINMLFDKCFSRCVKLQHIYIPKNTIVIGSGVFSYCNDLDIEVHSDNAMYTSEGGILFRKDKKELVSFAKGSKVADYAVPSGVTTLSDSAFEGSDVVSVRIAGNVTKIPKNCFNYCQVLEMVELPSSVTSIDSSAFTYCRGLFRFTIHASTAPTVTTSTFYDGSQNQSYTGWNADDSIKKLYVPVGATGYNTGAWLDPLCNSSKCGFTLSATL
jgi:hypothetical protein